MRRAIVSGITGHLGTALSGHLLAAGIEVHGLTRRNIDSTQPPGLMQAVRLHQVDGRTDTTISLFEKIQPDVVIHLAALARREHLSSDVVPFITANVLFGTQLMEAAKNVGCLRFITTGSYLQHCERGNYRAFNLYAATKQAFDDLLAYYVDAFDFAGVVLTLCNVYSELDPRPTLLTQMVAAYADAVPLSLHAGEAWVDLVHVEDAAAALVQVIRLFEAKHIGAKTLSRYSISSGRDMTYAGLMAVFEGLGMREATISFGRSQNPARRIKPWRGIGVPGWTPGISIQEGVARLLARRRETISLTEEV
jgi:nucleoside-diphosphate-sugar epimerase